MQGPAEVHAFLNALVPLQLLEKLGLLATWVSPGELRIVALL